MAKTFRKSDGYMRSLVEEVMRMYHPDLIEYEVTVDLIDAYDSAGNAAVTHGGLPAYAVIRTIPLKDRVMGRGDAEITFDALRVGHMTERQRKALIDHELTHLEFKLNKDGEKTVDDIGRYVFKMKPHDREFGWFESVAMRWGKDSIESAQAREMVSDEYFQKYFLLEGLSPQEQLGTEASFVDAEAPVPVQPETVKIVGLIGVSDEPNKNGNVYTGEALSGMIDRDKFKDAVFEHVDHDITRIHPQPGPDIVEQSMQHIPVDSPQFLPRPNGS